MSEFIGDYYPALPAFEDVASHLRQLAEAGTVALDGLRAAIGRKKEEITDEDRANAAEVRRKSGVRDVIQPRGTETSQPHEEETGGRRTLIPDDNPDD